ncbi:MAG: hypothetical protein S4CHLAM123_02020 [Chlamydiales bacterium]|nr:hypothetical protein [Chlamydiales bacterium]
MTTTHPFNWIRQIDQALLDLEEKPQFGLPKSIDWEQLKRDLQQALGCPNLLIRHAVKGWMTPPQAFEGQSQALKPQSIVWSTIGSASYFVCDEQTLKQMMKELLGSEEGAAFFFESSLVDGFYQYLTAEILYVIEKQGFASPLTPRIGMEAAQFKELIGDQACFVIDVCLEINHKHCWGRILLPESFRQEWKNAFGTLSPSKLPDETLEKITVDLGLEVGHTELTLKEWQSVQPRDFVLLDHCAYDPDEQKGSLLLTLQDRPIFRGRFKEGAIKLSGYPVYEEVSDMMEDEENLFEDEEEQESVSEEEGEEESFISTELVSPEESGIHPEELPIRLTVEVGRLRMTAKELIALAPGNLLELNVSPEQGVDLVVNGKKVGRGELIKMGDVLGVRIISL